MKVKELVYHCKRTDDCRLCDYEQECEQYMKMVRNECLTAVSRIPENLPIDSSIMEVEL